MRWWRRAARTVVAGMVAGLVWGAVMFLLWPPDHLPRSLHTVGRGALDGGLAMAVVAVAVAWTERGHPLDRLSAAQRREASAVLDGKDLTFDPVVWQATLDLAVHNTQLRKTIPRAVAVFGGLLTVTAMLTDQHSWQRQAVALVVTVVPLVAWITYRQRKTAQRFLASVGQAAGHQQCQQ